ncbi:MAG TPA: EAL domain-containing protein [Mycobacteriales bacterium]|nr:EAL domain-containing protein [Mycobacteriales bacterium]
MTRLSPSVPVPRAGEAVRRVLLVEDNPADAYLTVDSLAVGGSGTVCELVGRLGDVTTARLAAVDCVIVDLSLPDAQGLEAVIRLRRLDAGVPVIVLTGDDDLELATAALQHGAQDYLVKGHADSHALDRAIRYAQERKRLETALAHQALHDPLTGLANRALFRDRLEHALERVRRHGTTAAVLFCDLDHFKAVNDSLGHRAGDELLVTVARRLRGVLREEDTLARFGGDEFTVLVEELDAPGEAEGLAQRVRETLTAPVVVDGRSLHVDVSTGIVLAERDDDPETLLRNADIALYAAKEQGRGRVAWFDQSLHTAVVHRVTLENDLRAAVTGGGLALAYQPVIDLDRSSVVLLEALVRWHHPQRGLLPPAEFLGVAESTGLVATLDRFVIARAVEDLRRWRASTGSSVPVSVNVSGRTLAEADFPAFVLGTLGDAGVPAHSLVLEIVENAFVDAEAAARLADLRAAGVRLALDDFGAGVSSLQQFLTLSVDALKLDGSLLGGGVDTGDRGRTLLGLLARVGEDMGVHVIAEGVETAEQLQVVRGLGLRLGQGFLWATPAEPAAGGLPYTGGLDLGRL